MIDEHVTPEQIRSFRAGRLPMGESRRVGNHVAACADCSRLAPSGTTTALVRALGALDEEHPDPDTIAAFVEGRLASERQQELEEHLHECVRCSEDVDDLRALLPQMRGTADAEVRPFPPRARRRTAIYALAVAAAIAVIAFLYLAPRREESRLTPAAIRRVTPPATSTAPSPWPANVRDTIESGRLDPPRSFLELQQPLDAFRGESSGAKPATRLLAPVDQVVASARPTFRWEPSDGAHYVVIVAEHGRVLTQSPELDRAFWTPERELPRGRTYEWELEVIRDTTRTAVPAPPEPPVRFAVLDAGAAAELDTARKRSPDDHLLLGVLAAQAGLHDEATGELKQAAASHGTATQASALLRSLDRWPRRPGLREHR
jgi:hypothetical protein